MICMFIENTRYIIFIKNSDKILDLMVSIWFIPLHMVTLGKV